MIDTPNTRAASYSSVEDIIHVSEQFERENYNLREALQMIAEFHEQHENSGSLTRSGLLYDARCVARSALLNNDESLQIRLIPCPFCGHIRFKPSVEFYDVDIKNRRPWGFAVTCPHCEAQGPRCSTVEDAEDEWNKRQIIYPNAQVLTSEERGL